MSSVKLEYKKLFDDAKIPTHNLDTDAGLDLSSIEDVWLQPNTVTTVETGICISCPPGYYMTIEGRSSLYKKGIFPARGVIDSTFSGLLKVMLFNFSAPHEVSYQVLKGDRIAQLILHKKYNANLVEVKEFSKEYSTRGNNGFGSSGR